MDVSGLTHSSAIFKNRWGWRGSAKHPSNWNSTMAPRLYRKIIIYSVRGVISFLLLIPAQQTDMDRTGRWLLVQLGARTLRLLVRQPQRLVRMATLPKGLMPYHRDESETVVAS